MLETHFKFTNEDGQITETRKTYKEEVISITPAIELIVTDFKNHLLSIGYMEGTINEAVMNIFDLDD